MMNIYILIIIFLVACTTWSILFALNQIKKYKDLELSFSTEKKESRIILDNTEHEITLKSIEESYLKGTLNDQEIEKLKDLNKIYEILILKRNGYVSEITGKPKPNNTNKNETSNSVNHIDLLDDFDIEEGIVGDFEG